MITLKIPVTNSKMNTVRPANPNHRRTSLVLSDRCFLLYNASKQLILTTAEQPNATKTDTANTKFIMIEFKMFIIILILITKIVVQMD